MSEFFAEYAQAHFSRQMKPLISAGGTTAVESGVFSFNEGD
jgi:hypothetical protein